MKKSPEEILNDIKTNVREGIKNVLAVSGIDVSNPSSKEKHADILLSGWHTVKSKFMEKWLPKLSEEEVDEVVSYLKQEKSLHSIKGFVKQEYKDALLERLGLDQYTVSKIDPDVFDKINELSFGANIAYNTLLSIMNENLEILLGKAYKNEAGIHEEAEDLWLSEVFERVMIEFVQYGKDVVDELEDYAKSKGFFDGFDKDMLHNIYNKLFEEKLNEIRHIRAINKIE